MLKPDLGRYKIEKWLGGGAFSDIYLATDKILNEKVALKVPKLKFISFEEVVNEAKTLLKASHPSIVRFFQLEIIDNIPIIVMEYIKGETLRERLKTQRKISEIESLEIVIQILESIEYLHSLNIMHRDLKPENIFIEENDRIKIGDLGISILNEDVIKNKIEIKGTLNYMAPEAFKGKYFPSSDLWSIGLILYEMLKGQHPYSDKEIENYYEYLKDKNIFDFKEISTPFVYILKKALNFEVALRYQTARDFIKDLLTISDGRRLVYFKEKESISYLSGLTESQKRAVFTDKKNLLLLGIAGSGKTTVIARRIAYLIQEKNVLPENILTLTFTNKAASEMKSKIKIYTGRNFFNLLIGTFHYFCNRILRNESYLLGLDSEYKIISQYTRNKLLSRIIEEIFYEYKFKLDYNLSFYVEKEISNFKSNLVEPSDVLKKANTKRELFIGEVYKRYNEILKEENKIDYDDLIFLVIKLFTEHPDVLEKYKRIYQYIFVDEFQDINEAQFKLIKLLTGDSNTLFAAGDDDQNIYSFRGTSIKFIKNFKNLFPDSEVIYLEENFRSSSIIIEKAFNLISHNRERLTKKFVAKNNQQGEIIFKTFNSKEEQALFVVKEIINLIKTRFFSYNDFAILYRMNYQSQIFEKYLRKYNIPYNLVSSEPFFLREEVESLISILKIKTKFALTPFLIISALNFPKKIVNSKIINVINELIKGITDFKNLKNAIFNSRDIPNRIKKRLKIIEKIIENKETDSLIKLIEEIYKEYRIEKLIENTKRINELSRYLNIKEFLNIAKSFVEEHNIDSIKEFLDYIMLQQSADFLKSSENSVKLLTVHSAKGLQFKVIFIVDLEEGIFPHRLSMDSIESIEEERRLFFVGLTRAENFVYLLNSSHPNTSRFIYEMKI